MTTTPTLPTTVHTDLPAVSLVRRRTSARSTTGATYLAPTGWTADEYRGGTCAALVATVTIADLDWEVVILPDDGLSLPWADTEYLTWHVGANRWDEERGGTWVLARGQWGTDDYEPQDLVLPALREGDPFPNHAVVRWLETLVAEGHVELV